MSFVIPLSKDESSSSSSDGPRLLTHLIREKNWSRVSRRLSKSPLECNLWIKVAADGEQKSDDKTREDKELALHFAIRSKAPSRVIKKMIQKHPKALRIRDGVYQRYPLHLACLHTPDYDIIKLMIEKFPRALFHQDSLGRVPLHYTAFGGASLETFQLVLSKNTEGAKVEETYGWLPIHVATKMACSFDIMARLVEAYPAGITSLTKKKSTPKRLARTLNGPKSPIEEVVDVLEAAVLATEERDVHVPFQNIAETLWMERQHKLGLSRMSPSITDELDIEASEHRGSDIRNSDAGGVSDDLDDAVAKDGAPAVLLENPSSTNKQCVICMEAASTHVYVPCGHLCICEECLAMQDESDSQSSCSSSSKRCLVCRKRAFLVMKVFS